MKMKPVVSSTISAIGYDDKGLKMHVEFNSGTTYVYHDVSQKEYENLSHGPLSLGKNVMTLIKKKTYIKL